MKKIITILLLLTFYKAKSQPYLDIAYLKFQHSPSAGLWSRNNTTNKFNFFNAGMNIPFQFKKDSSVLVVSMAAELWNVEIKGITNMPGSFQSLIVPLTYVKPLSQKWTLSITGIARWNGTNKELFRNSFQKGGALLATYKKKKDLHFKFGFYYNSEFSGRFIVPLAGIDWKINNKNNLFGVLPGNLVYEHKLNTHFYWGLAFKAITNSYISQNIISSSSQKFLRVDDNQLSLFIDNYLSKKLVLTTEIGHSALRKFRLGIRDASTKYFYEAKMNDDLLFKISFSYRVRFR